MWASWSTEQHQTGKPMSPKVANHHIAVSFYHHISQSYQIHIYSIIKWNLRGKNMVFFCDISTGQSKDICLQAAWAEALISSALRPPQTHHITDGLLPLLHICLHSNQYELIYSSYTWHNGRVVRCRSKSL